MTKKKVGSGREKKGLIKRQKRGRVRKTKTRKEENGGLVQSI